MREIRRQAYKDYNSAYVQIYYSQLNNIFTLDWNLQPVKQLTAAERRLSIYFNAINYAFWDPANNNKTWAAFGTAGATAAKQGMEYYLRGKHTFEQCFPNIPFKEPRQRAVEELDRRRDVVERIANQAQTLSTPADLAILFPQAYSGDVYLKRAVLAFQELYPTNLLNLPAGADYRLPQVLRHLNILRYTDDLAYRVDNHRQILVDTTEERSIRAATIIVCDALAALTGLTPRDIDQILWTNRHCASQPHHLCETTNY